MLFHLVAGKGLLEERQMRAEEVDGDVDHGHHEDEDEDSRKSMAKGSREKAWIHSPAAVARSHSLKMSVNVGTYRK